MGILIVEDDGPVSIYIEDILRKEDYHIVDILYESNGVIERAVKNDVSLILMDINLSNKTNDFSGIFLAKEIRKEVDTPIIFLTGYARRGIFDKTADIHNSLYLTKPIRDVELLSMISNYMRSDDILIVLDNEFSFNMNTLELVQDNQVISLNKQQSELLKFFIRNKNKLLSHMTIEQRIWNDSISDSTRIALVSKLRTKLKRKFIYTSSGRGYIFKF